MLAFASSTIPLGEADVAASFTCENCRRPQTLVEDGDGYVECPFCEHTVHKDVYLGPQPETLTSLYVNDFDPENADEEWARENNTRLTPIGYGKVIIRVSEYGEDAMNTWARHDIERVRDFLNKVLEE